MQDQITDSISESVKQINNLWLTSFENSINLQMEAFNHYALIGLEQVKKVIEIKNMEDLQALASEQSNLTESINKQLIDDSNAISDLTQEFIKNSERVWQML